MCENRSLHTHSSFRLLVVRLGAMGDILHALPAVSALRAAHPEWHIGWVVEPRWRALLKAGSEGPWDRGNDSEPRGTTMPLVDQLHFAGMREWKSRPLSSATRAEIHALRRELRAEGYNAVLSGIFID